MRRKGDEERSCSTTRNAKKEEEEKEVEEKEKNSATNMFSQITKWATICPLLITCYLHFVQNWCGVNVIVFKVFLRKLLTFGCKFLLQTVSVFESLGTSLDSGTCTLAVGGTQVSQTFHIFIFDCFE